MHCRAADTIGAVTVNAKGHFTGEGDRAYGAQVLVFVQMRRMPRRQLVDMQGSAIDASDNLCRPAYNVSLREAHSCQVRCTYLEFIGPKSHG